ncbi:ATP-binding cassette domain-containing protein [Patescibacteria group bacterium]|nr:ATP-binding cassette domain-containing protein [Patescibacteria group bacterium]
MKNIIIKNITKNNLNKFSVKIPLQKLVAIVGPSGSGKSTLVEDVLYNNSLENKWNIRNLPKKVFILEQKVILPKSSKLSLGEFNLRKLKKKLSELKKEDLLIVDEPCAGFCKKERELILKMLQDKVKLGFSIIAVEHNKEIIVNADYVIELGPGSGRYGGKLIFQGNLKEFEKSKTITAKCVFTKDKKQKNNYSQNKNKEITISEINVNNFKDFNFSFPLTSIVCLTGCSGSGKTTLLDTTYRALFKGKNAWKIRLKNVNVKGKTNVRRSYIVPQIPISDHPTSILATYTNIWGNVRDIFANQELSKKLKLKRSDFIISKSILDKKNDFSKDVLKVLFNKKNIRDVMNMTIDEALELFKEDSLIVRKLEFLQEVGLGYLVLGQKSSSLSGGEAQRVRISNILSKKLGDRSIYIFDTPSRGLHMMDIPVLIKVFRKIISKNNTILIADNREEIFEYCDYKANLLKTSSIVIY